MRVNNIVTTGTTKEGAAIRPTITIVNGEGREEVLLCTAEVAAQVETGGYASQKTRVYEFQLKPDTKEVVSIQASDPQAPRGLRLAVDPYNEIPRNALVFRRDVVDGKPTAWKAIQTPMSFSTQALDAILQALPKATLGQAVAHGYTWFRSIQQVPGQEYAVLKK